MDKIGCQIIRPVCSFIKTHIKQTCSHHIELTIENTKKNKGNKFYDKVEHNNPFFERNLVRFSHDFQKSATIEMVKMVKMLEKYPRMK